MTFERAVSKTFSKGTSDSHMIRRSTNPIYNIRDSILECMKPFIDISDPLASQINKWGIKEKDEHSVFQKWKCKLYKFSIVNLFNLWMW